MLKTLKEQYLHIFIINHKICNILLIKVTIDDSDFKQQLCIVENGVLYSAKLYNDLKVKNEILAKQLKRKIDNLEEQKKNYIALNSMKKVCKYHLKLFQNLIL